MSQKIDRIESYNDQISEDRRELVDLLFSEISKNLTGAESKVWHGSPVWFLEENPIVGYSNNKKGVQLLFWSGQSFDEPLLTPTGKSKAAEKIYTKSSEINYEDLRRWLEKSANIQWDYKNIVKRKGELIRLK